MTGGHDRADVAAPYGLVVPDDLTIAHQLVRRGHLCVRRGHTDDEAARALARALRVWGPDHPHGALVLEALRPRSRAERRAGRRSYDLRAIRLLLEIGRTPTPHSVGVWAGRLRALEAQAEQGAPAREPQRPPPAGVQEALNGSPGRENGPQTPAGSS